LRHMTRLASTGLGLSLVLAACGGGAPGPAAPSADSTVPAAGSPATPDDPGGAIGDPAPAGEAEMIVEGQTLSFTEAISCDIREDEFNFVFVAADGASQMRGSGARFEGDTWGGSIGAYGEDEMVAEYNAPLTTPGISVLLEPNVLIFVGPISTPSGELSEGSVRATCP
jgi:hypothetical protein